MPATNADIFITFIRLIIHLIEKITTSGIHLVTKNMYIIMRRCDCVVCVCFRLRLNTHLKCMCANLCYIMFYIFILSFILFVLHIIGLWPNKPV